MRLHSLSFSSSSLKGAFQMVGVAGGGGSRVGSPREPWEIARPAAPAPSARAKAVQLVNCCPLQLWLRWSVRLACSMWSPSCRGDPS